jgi:hypothetical protein
MRRPVTLLALGPLALGLLAAGCGGAEPPVARLALEPGATPAAPGELTLGYPEVRRVTLVWEPLAALPADGAGPPLVFVHLVDGAGSVVRTFDHPFPAPWRPGTPVDDAVELYQSALAPPLPAGRYRLTAGLYRPGGERYPLAAEGEEIDGREYALATVAAAEGGAGLPAIEPTGDWLPVEPGADRQVLASRWLAGEGALVVAGAAEAGALWVRLRVPEPESGAVRLVLADGTAGQQVRLATPCGGAAALVTGPGDHEVELPVDPGAVAPAVAGAAAAGVPAAPAAGVEPAAASESAAGAESAAAAEPVRAGACPVTITANFHLAGPGGARRAVWLETVAWRRR